MANKNSADAGNAARPHAIVIDGRRYEFRLFGLPEMVEFERERFRLEREKLRELKDDYPTEKYVELLDEIRRRYDEHEFAFQTTDDEYMNTLEGALLLLRVVTGMSDSEISHLLRESREEVMQLVQVIVSESLPKQKAGPQEAESAEEAEEVAAAPEPWMPSGRRRR